ncbi:MAG: DHH family phosphoesterase [Paludisphaera borealis]|uniref:DHH family phosphoesterase n=1 Tax=Paludisphaera borealis TaxID=1387353 RepID=UPI00284A02A5|nr:DHH family phosphoesterase [Paludisphaera borealis]MDR3619038.1 DHH family phosphoesterase [Paludisphaera borealis]
MTGAGDSSQDVELEIDSQRRVRSDRLLATLAPFSRVVAVSHVNPDPDSLASMLGIRELIQQCQPGKPVILTVEGMIARAENRAMVELIPVPLVPIESVHFDRETAVVMVDSQPHTGRRSSEAAMPQVVIDHHETGGDLTGVLFQDIRTHLGASSTMVTGYLLEQRVLVSPQLATALYYGIESETTGYPREASSLDDGALVWLFPRADKELLARIHNPKLPQSHFATFQRALANAFLYRDLIVAWCGDVSQPDIIAEVADFFVRFDQVNWVLAVGLFDGGLKLSLRASALGGQAGEVLRDVVEGMGSAGGHDKRAGGVVPLADASPKLVEQSLTELRRRLLAHLDIDEHQGRRLLNECSRIPAP